MRQLRVAFFVKPSPSSMLREERNMGLFSYDVPEFTWDHYPHNNERVNMVNFRDYDVVVHEDAGFCTYDNKAAGPPIVYYAIDSTLTDAHLEKRIRHGKQADLILTDHDRPQRFNATGKRVLQLPYCVNDHLFKPREKTLDVGFHCGAGESKGMPGGKERNEIRRALHEYCGIAGYSYSSGVYGIQEYALALGRAKVIVNWPRTAINRPHRVFDSMACASALLTGILPYVDGDLVEPGIHYLQYEHHSEIPANLYELLKCEQWQHYGVAGYEMVAANHTWAVRAKQLREMLARELGL